MVNINPGSEHSNGFNADFSVPEKNNQLVAALAHEVRNPLATIKLAAEVLMQSNADENQRKYIAMILHCEQKINEIIKNTITVFEPKTKIVGEYALHQLLEEVLEATEDRFLMLNVAIAKNFTSHAPYVAVNKEEIKIAIGNIVLNALEAVPGDGGKLTITTIYDYSLCTIIIEDNGIGMSKEEMEQMFKPYYTTKVEGLGIGLSLTQDLLQANKVAVKVYSEKNAGTQFVLTFHIKHSQ